jgi:hypothetical protein
MALKLVTSETYVNNIRNFLPEKPNSKTPASEKSKKVFDKIINSPNFIFDKSDKKLTDYITTLLSIRPGRTLFKRLLKADKPLTILLDSTKGSCFKPDESTVFINDSEVDCICTNPNGEKILHGNASISLAHELVHVLHYFEDSEFTTKLKSRNIIDPEFDYLEEQETIIGKEKEAVLCENVFRFHFGYPLRINHRGATSFTASDCAGQGYLGSLKEMLLANPSLLNLPQPFTTICSSGEATPLNAAISGGQQEIVAYLFEIGVDVHARDERFGTALHTAAIFNPSWIPELIKKGIDPNAKNPEGFTAFELALGDKNANPEFLAPLTNLKELEMLDEKGYSILHRTLREGNLEGFRILIRHGVDINSKDSSGNTSLMHCCYNEFYSYFALSAQYKEKFMFLLENEQLDLNATNIKGESALSLAVQKGNLPQVDALVKKGAEVPPHLKDQVERCIDLYREQESIKEQRAKLLF